MRDVLAERLLAEIMQWSDEDMARERPIFLSMAAYKYDEYQQFIPGMRFVESLALWLGQFETLEEKKIAYEFVKTKLIFFSNAEINHFVEMAYPDFIRPLLLKKTAQKYRLNPWQVGKIAESLEFKIAQRKTLFVGLSDGSRIDVFRRFNSVLSHEQIYPIYEISSERAKSLIDKLNADLIKITGEENTEDHRFDAVVMLDDFSASGLSYIREEDGKFEGKIAKIYELVNKSESALINLFDWSQTDFYIVLYLATEHARQNSEQLWRKMWKKANGECSVVVVHPISDLVKIKAGDHEPFNNLIEKYYDNSIETEHTEKGGSDLKFGFNKCGLPVVLSHNTPNNSLALLWAENERYRALFPRVSRHK